LNALKYFLGFWLTAVFAVAITFPMVEHPTVWYQFPIVPGLEDKARILFFHVPMAWVTVVAFIVAMIYGIKYLAKKDIEDDLRSVASAGQNLTGDRSGTGIPVKLLFLSCC
jgi:heme exporter protein C